MRVGITRKIESTGALPAGMTRSRQMLALIVGAFGITVWWGSQREAADATKPIGLVDPQNVTVLDESTIRVGSFNIHCAKGDDGQVDLGRVAKCLANLDFVSLNEVRGAANYRKTQAAILGRKLGMASMFAPTERRWWHGHFGNGLLTRAELTGWQVIPLVGTRDHKFRNAILTSIKHKDTDVRILLTHLDTQDDRRIQLQSVIHLFLALREPAILMGDFNTTANDPLLQGLLQTPGVTDAVQAGIKHPLPGNRIDWIITRGLRCVDAGYEETDASDHPVVWAELGIDPTHKIPSRNVPMTASKREAKHD